MNLNYIQVICLGGYLRLRDILQFSMIIVHSRKKLSCWIHDANVGYLDLRPKVVLFFFVFFFFLLIYIFLAPFAKQFKSVHSTLIKSLTITLSINKFLLDTLLIGIKITELNNT